MKRCCVPKLALLFLALCFSPLNAVAKSQYHSWQEEADRLYSEREFEQAYPIYLKLAKKGDSFSQYRVSYMNLQAEGRSMDLVESFAWAALATQNNQKEIVEYAKAVAAMVPEDKRRKADRKVDYYFRKWGNIAIANDAVKGAREQTRDCTGSRLGGRCDEIYAAQMPNFWGINPGNGSGADGGSASPSGSVSGRAMEVGGGSGRDTAYYQSLRDQIATLNRYIQENSGNVEIGELEVIEEEQPDQGASESGSRR